jgi:hypothetical protein
MSFPLVLAAGALAWLLASKKKKSTPAVVDASRGSESAARLPGETVSEVVDTLPPSALADRIVRESTEILRGQRDAYTPAPAAQDDDDDDDAQAMAPGPEPVPVAVAPSPAAQQAAQSPGVPVSEVVPSAPSAAPVAVPQAAQDDDDDDDDAQAVVPGPEPVPVAVAPSPAAQQAMASPGQPVSEVVEASPEQAARDLSAFAREVLARGQGAKLGTRGNPSERVRELQADMGGIEADGFYGPATRARGQQLGVEMPVRR